MLMNNRYNKIRLLNDLSQICWFLEKHAIADAEKDNDQCCINAFKQLKQQIDNQIEKLQEALCKCPK